MNYVVTYKVGDKEKENIFFWRKTTLGKSMLKFFSLLLAFGISLCLWFYGVLTGWGVLSGFFVSYFTSLGGLLSYLYYVNSPFYFSYGTCHDKSVTFTFYGSPGDLKIEDGYRDVLWEEGTYRIYRDGKDSMAVKGFMVHYIPSSVELHENTELYRQSQ